MSEEQYAQTDHVDECVCGNEKKVEDTQCYECRQDDLFNH